MNLENLPFGNTMAEVDSEGKFTLTNMGLMTYRLSVVGLSNGAYLASAQYGSVDPLSDMLQVNDEGTKLVLQLAFTPGNLSGIVTDKAGKPFQGATCILIPARRNRLDLFRTATSDQDGRFSLANLTPGEYKFLALEDIPIGAHMDPAFLKNYEDRAKTIVIDKGEAEVADIQVIPASE